MADISSVRFLTAGLIYLQPPVPGGRFKTPLTAGIPPMAPLDSITRLPPPIPGSASSKPQPSLVIIYFINTEGINRKECRLKPVLFSPSFYNPYVTRTRPRELESEDPGPRDQNPDTFFRAANSEAELEKEILLIQHPFRNGIKERADRYALVNPHDRLAKQGRYGDYFDFFRSSNPLVVNGIRTDHKFNRAVLNPGYPFSIQQDMGKTGQNPLCSPLFQAFGHFNQSSAGDTEIINNNRIFPLDITDDIQEFYGFVMGFAHFIFDRHGNSQIRPVFPGMLGKPGIRRNHH